MGCITITYVYIKQKGVLPVISFVKILFMVFVKQILVFASFAVAIYVKIGFLEWVAIILLLLYLISYFKYSDKTSKKLNLDKKLYDIYSFISWLLGSGFFLGILFDNWIWKILPTKGGWFSGLEYITIPILFGLYLIIVCLLKLIIFITSKLTKNKQKL